MYQFILITISEERRIIIEEQFKELNITVPLIVLSNPATPANSIDYLPPNIDVQTQKVMCCSLDHYRAIDLASHDDSPAFSIIIEDDVAFHKTKFIKGIEETIKNWDRVAGSDKMVSIGWVPCSHYSNYLPVKPTYVFESIDGVKIIKDRFVLGTQAYIVKRDDIKSYVPLLLHNTFADLEKTVKSLDYNNLKSISCVAVDCVINKVLGQAIVFPPLAIEQNVKSTVSPNTIERKYWDIFYKHVEHYITEYWSFAHKTQLLMIAIFKNESHIMKEWIDHYIYQGVDKFILIDNGSTDNYKDDIKRYLDNGIVEVFEQPEPYKQVEHYNKHYNRAIHYDWVIVVDFDEFVYARKGYDTIKDYLLSLDHTIHQVIIPPKNFGSSGHIEQPKNVVKNFTKREKHTDILRIGPKVITRGNHLSDINIHFSHLLKEETYTNNRITADGAIFDKTDLFDVYISEDILDAGFLHLNHYIIQSYNWYTNVKCTRGHATNTILEKKRTADYFKKHDRYDCDDYELKNISNKYDSSLYNF